MIGVVRPAGDLTETGGTASGVEYAPQKIQQVLSLLLGEWFLDGNLGIPWVEGILVKNPNFEYIRGVLRRAILTVPGIVDVPYLTVSEPNAERRVEISFRATYRDGQSVEGNVVTPEVLS